MRALNRTAAFFTTWSSEFIRQPALMLTLVAGPFLILLAFGQGVDISEVRPRVMVVEPPAGEQQELQPLPAELDEHVEVVGVTTNIDEARESLRRGDIDAIAVIPQDPDGQLRRGERVPIQILTSEIDPLQRTLVRGYLDSRVAELNRRTIEEAIAEIQHSVAGLEQQASKARDYIALARESRDEIVDAREWVEQLNALMTPVQSAADTFGIALNGIPFVIPGWGSPSARFQELQVALDDIAATVDSLDTRLNSVDSPVLPSDEELAQIDKDLATVEELGAELRAVPPDVLSAPFELELGNVAPFVPDFAGFYAPSILALLLQHLGISIAALSATRLRHTGLLDVLRVSPSRPFEVVNGNYFAYGFVLAIAAAGILALMIFALSVPVYGSYLLLAATVGLLIAVSLGVGFLIALASSSEKQAAQLAMLVLLASVFFSGLVITLERVSWPMKAVSYAIPSTYGIRALQDIMLRGILRHPLDLVILAAAAVALYFLAILLFKRDFRPD